MARHVYPACTGPPSEEREDATGVGDYPSLALGLVDAVVMAQAERHRARIIVTTDGRDFRAVTLALDPAPRLVPLD